MDPVTFLVICAIVAVATDGATEGWVRAEVWGGASGAGRHLWETESRRARTARARRRAANSETRFGRFKNAIGEELLQVGSALVRGWRSGRRSAQQRRRERRAETERRRAEARAAIPDEEVPDPNEPPNVEAETDPHAQVSVSSDTPNETPEEAPPPAPEVGAPPPEQQEGPVMSDITTAPEAIAYWKAIQAKCSDLADEVLDLAKQAGQGADDMGDFAVGSEDEGAGSVRAFATAGDRALEMLAGIIASLEAEFGASIEAADGKSAAVHAPMQAA